MDATVLLGTFNATDLFVVFPRSVPPHKPVSELCGTFLWPHGLFLYRVGLLYRQVCGKSNQLNLQQMDSSKSAETSQRWSREMGRTWATFQMSQQRNTYARWCFQEPYCILITFTPSLPQKLSLWMIWRYLIFSRSKISHILCLFCVKSNKWVMLQ